jgi:hypothetical protein
VVVAVVLLLAGLVAYRLLDASARIEVYREIGPGALLLETIGGRNAWVRVTDVVETPTQVTVTVRSLYIQLGPTTAQGYVYESLAQLADPLGDRTVIDGSDGHVVERTNCPPYNFPCP